MIGITELPDPKSVTSLKHVIEDLLKKLDNKTEVFNCLSTLISKLINRSSNTKKVQILNEYVTFALGLLKPATDSLNAHGTQASDGSDIVATCDDVSLKDVLVDMLCVSALTIALEQHCDKALNEINARSIFLLSLKLLPQSSRILNQLTSTPSLCLLGNLVHLASMNTTVLKNYKIDFVILCTKILELCQKNMQQNPNSKKKDAKSTDRSFNHILDWLVHEHSSITIDQDTSKLIRKQLNHLWSRKLLTILFDDLITNNEACNNVMKQGANIKDLSMANLRHKSCESPRHSVERDDQPFCDVTQPTTMNIFRRAVERATLTITKTLNSSYAKTSGSISPSAKLMTEDAVRISLVCHMFQTALKTLINIEQNVLVGICLHDQIVKGLWTFISSLGSHNGLKAFLDHLTLYTKANAPEFHILTLFCDCVSHLVSVLDDSELYEHEKPFSLKDLLDISMFLNNFVHRIVSNQLVQVKDPDPLLQATHKLLMDLYKRDCRRRFVPQDQWLIKDMKLNAFIKDIDSRKDSAMDLLRLMPHTIPYKDRVIIFRRDVAHDKSVNLTGFSTFITIRRSSIVEDGYLQLAGLPPKALKGMVRVKFINDLGLDEAGIDQDGVFKEFLEDTIKRVFDPAFNLFCTTSDERLYPSPTSRVQDDHLSLFNFIGKMVGKAVYEGIVVDVPFATFFLSRVLGLPQSPLYSPMDELASLDAELYKNLTYIKHYEGDVSDLGLTFSIDQDYMGKIETYELEEGGKSKPVTKESRVRYIHEVANFRMKTQIEQQTGAFVEGFKSIVNLEWLSMFSASEFQRLISGDTAPIDLQDLRRHSKYFGGFHNNHRVINWLWDILERDYTAEEHSLFLKFVTSCSKPPVLGFANLEPPFSIRCVEVSDDQDLGDTVGSVLRGFFAIRRSDPVDRLPTSSTCFNLLKLPNYQRRSTLKEKLRYAIRSGTGFELS